MTDTDRAQADGCLRDAAWVVVLVVLLMLGVPALLVAFARYWLWLGGLL